VKFGRTVLQVNVHRLKESDFRFDFTLSRWWPGRHFTQKSAATRWSEHNLLKAKGLVIYNPISQIDLRGVTCHMGLQCYLLPDTSEHTFILQRKPSSWFIHSYMSLLLFWRSWSARG